VQGKKPPQRTKLGTLSPIVRMPFLSKHFYTLQNFKTAGGKAGLQAAMKNDRSLPKHLQIIYLNQPCKN